MDGSTSTVLEYATEYKALKDIDDIERESILMAKRTELCEEGQDSLVVAIEKCIDYEYFGGSKTLIDFIDLTKKTIVAVMEKPRLVMKFTNEWENNNPIDPYRTDESLCIENLTIAMLTKYTYDYIKEIT